MKRGNIGLALGMVGKKIKSSLRASVDLGLTGKDGVVHPSLTVRLSEDAFSESLGCLLLLRSSAPYLLLGKCKEAGRERQFVWIDRGEPAVQIREGKRLILHSGNETSAGFGCWRISISFDLNSVSLKLQCQRCFPDDGDLIFSSHAF